MSGCKKFWADLLSLSMPIANAHCPIAQPYLSEMTWWTGRLDLGVKVHYICHLIVHLYTAGLYWQCHGACWCTWLCFVFVSVIVGKKLWNKVIWPGEVMVQPSGESGLTGNSVYPPSSSCFSCSSSSISSSLIPIWIVAFVPSSNLCLLPFLISHLCSIYHRFIYISVLLHLKGIISKNWTCSVLAGWILCVNVAHNSSLQSLDEKVIRTGCAVHSRHSVHTVHIAQCALLLQWQRAAFVPSSPSLSPPTPPFSHFLHVLQPVRY